REFAIWAKAVVQVLIHDDNTVSLGFQQVRLHPLL
ncbi:hypothetical protein ACGLE7_002775, partial [Escherichia coli]